MSFDNGKKIITLNFLVFTKLAPSASAAVGVSIIDPSRNPNNSRNSSLINGTGNIYTLLHHSPCQISNRICQLIRLANPCHAHIF